MKFNGSQFWRYRGDCCMFMEILAVISDDGETAELRVSWNKQMDKGWKPLGAENIRVRASEYSSWVSCQPRGIKLDALQPSRVPKLP